MHILINRAPVIAKKAIGSVKIAQKGGRTCVSPRMTHPSITVKKVMYPKIVTEKIRKVGKKRTDGTQKGTTPIKTNTGSQGINSLK